MYGSSKISRSTTVCDTGSSINDVYGHRGRDYAFCDNNIGTLILKSVMMGGGKGNARNCVTSFIDDVYVEFSSVQFIIKVV